MLLVFTIFLFTFLGLNQGKITRIPDDFVFLRELDPTIVQDMRYNTFHNFVGRPISGYFGGECILTRKAAEALSRVQKRLLSTGNFSECFKQEMVFFLNKNYFSFLSQGHSLKTYDCYRPQKAVKDFLMWSMDPSMDEMQGEFYSTTAKTDLFDLGYISNTSGHCRGSTMDLTIVRLPVKHQEVYHVGDDLRPCVNEVDQRFKDNSLNFGTGFDCFDTKANTANNSITEEERKNREFLLEVMEAEGFVNYPFEWWHFTLSNEPYPNTPFNFDIYPIEAYRRKFPLNENARDPEHEQELRRFL